MPSPFIPTGPVSAFIAPAWFFDELSLPEVGAKASERGLVACYQAVGKRQRLALFSPKRIPPGWVPLAMADAPTNPAKEIAQ